MMKDEYDNKNIIGGGMGYIVYVVDDDESVANSLKWLIEPLGYEVSIFNNGQDFLDRIIGKGYSDVGCLIVDVRMPVMGGFELQKELKKLDFKLPMIFLSGHGDIPQAVSAIKDGADDFLQKPINDQELLDKINGAIRKSIKESALDTATMDAAGKIACLSDRELEILRQVADGKSSKVIAKTLNISYKTVEVHRANIRKKLGVKSVAELTKVYFESI